MADAPHQRQGFSSTQGRQAKAIKILAILEQAGHPVRPGQNILDLGTGSGHIASNLSQLAQVIACDIVDQRTAGLDLPFARCADRLPFPDHSFDLVISNHVIEHVADPALQLREIRRILKPGGLAYLATPNRWWPWEVHTRLPLLHYLPAAWFSRLAMMLGCSGEPLRLQSLAGLRRQGRDLFHIEPWHHRLLRHPERYALHLPPWATSLISLLPDGLIALSKALQPTLICLLRPR